MGPQEVPALEHRLFGHGLQRLLSELGLLFVLSLPLEAILRPCIQHVRLDKCRREPKAAPVCVPYQVRVMARRIVDDLLCGTREGTRARENQQYSREVSSTAISIIRFGQQNLLLAMEFLRLDLDGRFSWMSAVVLHGPASIATRPYRSGAVRAVRTAHGAQSSATRTAGRGISKGNLRTRGGSARNEAPRAKRRRHIRFVKTANSNFQLAGGLRRLEHATPGKGGKGGRVL